MRTNASTPDEYVAALPAERRELVSTLRQVNNEALSQCRDMTSTT